MSDEKPEAESEGGIGQSASTAGLGAWLPIETAPDDKRMFVVQAFNVETGLHTSRGGYRYTTDPWCVWKCRGEFVRWPHDFPPTHWTPLPEAPNVEVQRDSGSIIAGGSAGTTGSASLAGTEDEKDAARYRWLKTATKEQLLLWRGAWGCSDVAIDDAML